MALIGPRVQAEVPAHPEPGPRNFFQRLATWSAKARDAIEALFRAGALADRPAAAAANRGYLFEVTDDDGGTLFWSDGSTWNQIAKGVTEIVPISQGGTGQTSKTPAFNALSPLTTKGDLVVFDGTNDVRKAVGAPGQFLIADAAQSDGLAWSPLAVYNTVDRTTNFERAVVQFTANAAEFITEKGGTGTARPAIVGCRSGSAGSGNFTGIQADDGAATLYFLVQTATQARAQATGLVLPTTKSLRVYNTADETTNFERAVVQFTSNAAEFLTEKGGSGTARSAIMGSRSGSAGSGSFTGIQADDAGATLFFLVGTATKAKATASVFLVQVPLQAKIHANFTGSEGTVSTGAVRTTNATQTTVWSLTLADATLYFFEARIIGRDEAGTDRAFYIRAVRAHRQGGGAATLGTVQALVTDESNAAWDATFTVSSNDIRVSVTGAAGVNVSWAVTVIYQGVSTSA